jgi:hypothetical protein
MATGKSLELAAIKRPRPIWMHQNTGMNRRERRALGIKIQSSNTSVDKGHLDTVRSFLDKVRP